MDHVRVTREGLRRRAEARGVAASYRDWRGREVPVGERTLGAILDALGDDGPPSPAAGRHVPLAHAGPVNAAGVAPPPPLGQTWGFTLQLYSLRSRLSWGHGDMRDLADFAAWSASELGAGFAVINPLHAAEPVPPVSPSPYRPMTRRFISPLYLRIEDIAEYAQLPRADRARIGDLAAPLRTVTADALIDRDAVWRAKLAALTVIRRQPLSPARRASFERFKIGQGQALEDWSTWCALAEIHGPDWRSWPAPLRDPRSAAVAGERLRLRQRGEFHAWLAWLTDEQWAAAQKAARAAGMPIGIITDLAVGAHPGGADAWANQGLLVRGVSAGAPPDEFNQLGQVWGQPPWHPGRLAAAGYQPLSDLFGSALRHAGGLRVDHVMGLARLWWVPDGMTPDHGTYVRYDHQAMAGALIGAASRVGALAIGEDLGTVEEWLRDYLATHGVLGTSMLWFERTPDGAPLPPRRWRRNCLATVGTHDVPPAAAFVTGEQVVLRDRLGLLTHSLDTERHLARRTLSAWQEALVREGLLPTGGGGADPAEFTAALYGYLARTPAVLIGVSLADAVGDRRPQNLPGTTTQYPNWRIPLSDSEERPVLLEDLAGHPGVRAIARAVSLRMAAPGASIVPPPGTHR